MRTSCLQHPWSSPLFSLLWAALVAGTALWGCKGGGECAPDQVEDDNGDCVPVDDGGGEGEDDTGGSDDGGESTGDEGDDGDEGGDSGTDSGDSGDDGEEFDWSSAFEEGDPITVVAAVADNGEGFDLVEWMDAEILDASHGLVTGQGGWGIIDLETGATLEKSGDERGYRLARSGDYASIARRTGGLVVLDVSDTGLPVQLAEAKPFEGYHEDISMDGERILVGAHDEGAVFFDLELTQLATLPVDDAFAVGLVGDRAVVTHNTTLELWDVSDLDDAQLLDTVEMGGEGRDIAFDGAHLAVGLGGNGVGVYAVESDDTLVHRGDLEVPGSAFGVSLDGDYLWIGAWETAAVAWIGEGGPGILGHEFPAESAMGVGAGEGLALIADWKSQSVFQLEEGLAGAELVVPDRVTYPKGETDGIAVRIENDGVFDLEFTTSAPSDGWSWDDTPITLAPGAGALLVVTPPEDGSGSTFSIAYTSNDPDELSGEIEFRAADGSVGQPHPEFSLESFSWPDESVTLRGYDADDHDAIIFLAYFALY